MEHNCIRDTKPKIADFIIGQQWSCPTCHKIWWRIDETMEDGTRVVWATSSEYGPISRTKNRS